MFIGGALLAGIPVVRSGAPSSAALEQRLLTQFEKLRIADTHEQFFDERDRTSREFNVFDLIVQGYVGGAMTSGGLSGDAASIFRDDSALFASNPTSASLIAPDPYTFMAG